MKRILITGADGFIGRNLTTRLAERGDCEVLSITRESGAEDWTEAAGSADFVIHLAGVNRPQDPGEFDTGNRGTCVRLTAALEGAGNGAPVVLTSSIQAENDNPYGTSKRAAEEALADYGRRTGAPVHVFRLPNVFGKWSRPFYNSAVATFCHNIARGQEIDVHDPAAALHLVYIDDVVDAFLALIDEPGAADGYCEVSPTYRTTVGDVADLIRSFPSSRDTMVIPAVGAGLTRALYATYLSYLPPQDFAYRVPVHTDPRGEFVEMLKTRDSGQFSYFTAKPGITRGNHYHHSKAEKFLVLSGTAHYGFRHIVTGETHEITVKGGEGTIVETIPGWVHNITNIGDDELVVMLWANEIFDPRRPDTIAKEV